VEGSLAMVCEPRVPDGPMDDEGIVVTADPRASLEGLVGEDPRVSLEV
jgi:hypothetical protein